MSKNKLTQEQADLVAIDETTGRPLIERVAVLADAGSGKTSTLVQRIREYCKDKSQPPKILCVSFTEKSAADLETRLADLINCEVYTIHGYCARIIREFGSMIGIPPVFGILDTETEARLFQDAFDKVFRRTPQSLESRGITALFSVCKSYKASPRPIQSSTQRDLDLEKFYQEVLGEFSTAKKNAALLEYSDLEILAAELLGHASVAKQIQARYQHVFIDEFQDTSQIQCDIASRIVGPRSLFFVVGDEKQSIYRFRGADVAVFRAFIQNMEKKNLSANFRSDPMIIEAVNATCKPIIPGFEGMVAKREYPDTKPQRLAEVVCEDDVEGILAVIQHLESNGVDRSKAVLLLKKIKENKLLERLQEKGISISVTGGSSQLDDDFKKMVNLWIWATHPWLTQAAAQVLVDFAGSQDELQKIRAAFDQRLAALGDSVSGKMHTCISLLEELDARFGLSARFKVMFDLFRLFILRHHEKGIAPSELGIILKNLIEDDERIPDLVHYPPPPEIEGTLRAMTVHASKGLEFPYVILADLNKRQGGRNDGTLRAKDQIWFPSERDEKMNVVHAPGYDQARSQEAMSEGEEGARLLYVAMTRAERGLYIVKQPVEIDESVDVRLRTWSSWLEGKIESRVFANAWLSNDDKIKNDVVVKELDITAALHPISEKKPEYRQARIGVTALAEMNKEATPAGDLKNAEARKPVTVTQANKIRDLGTKVHVLLQHSLWDEIDRLPQTDSVNIAPFQKWLKTDEGKLIFQNPNVKRVFNEFAFDWVLDQQVVAGRIDRMMVFENEVWVIDFKVLSGRRDANTFVDGYSEQLNIYGAAIGALTKLPVKCFLLDVICATGSILHNVPQKK